MRASNKYIIQSMELVDEIIADTVKDEQDTRTIIKLIHDNIISNARYDKERADNNVIKYSSNTAYGVLFEGYGICSGCKCSETCNIAEVPAVEASDVYRLHFSVDYSFNTGKDGFRKPDGVGEIIC